MKLDKRSLAARSIPVVILLSVAVVSTAGLPLGNALWAKTLGVVGSIHIKKYHHHGCTPGFWKQEHHFKYWPARHSPKQFFSVAFQTSSGNGLTLMDALKLRGGGNEALMRQAVAALLNAGNGELDYRYTTDEVVEMFKQAAESGSYETVKDLYEAANSDGCLFGPPVTETTLGAEHMAYASHLQRTIYDWALAATVDPAGLEMEPESSDTFHVGLESQRFAVETKDEYRAEGLICLTNTGEGTTQDLAIDVLVQSIVGDGEPAEVASSTPDVSDKPALDPGESYCYFYKIPFTPDPAATYQTVAQVWIDNYLDHADAPYGPELVTAFDLPSPQETVEIDAESVLGLDLLCPQGFTCGIDDAGPWHLGDSASIGVDVGLTAGSPACTTHTVELNASLEESETGELRPAGIGVAIQVVGCAPADETPAAPTATPPAPSEIPEASPTPTEAAPPAEEPTPTPSS